MGKPFETAPLMFISRRDNKSTMKKEKKSFSRDLIECHVNKFEFKI
jgi:hypothetical protein